MNKYAIFILGKKYKEFNSLAGYEKHLLRTQNTPNADPEKFNQNEILKGAGINIVENVKDYIKNCKIRKNNVLVRDLLLSASREYFKDADLEKRYNWVKANVRFLEAEFGDNFRFGVVHYDEETPHIHALICPKFKDKQQVNVLSNDRYFGGKLKVIEWQNKYAKTMEPLGLTRGIERSKCNHEDIRQFYAYVDHMEELENIDNIDPKYIAVENMRLKTRVGGLEKTLEDYKKYLRLEKQAHQKTKEEKEQLQKEKENTKDYSFMLDCCLEYLADEKHISKEYISKMVEISIEKGEKLSFENNKNKENERGLEYER